MKRRTPTVSDFVNDDPLVVSIAKTALGVCAYIFTLAAFMFAGWVGFMIVPGNW